MQTLNEQDFLARPREARLSYAIHLESKESQDECYDMVAAGLQQPAHVLQHIPPENFMTATRERAWDGVDQLALACSAGHLVDELQQWYEASRREPCYDSHRRDTSFRGYWSWEAAAITCVLDIDDSGYRGAPFYPADLVALCRMQGKGPGA
ncbi:DUF1911 domain-containing protein [Janthinobacterium sp. PAMC25594]|uniref:DUF1911 domain-containing protein n=1 Tax=Janthinobacterium sp. PAMC25594 TaxID=2861284 RepID=UPI002158F7C5|nr:DUF1911 domain-containing protein [Janthinobacterium sp. PAMC25594]